ncbi:MAG: tetratricopeptide repeat protein [Nitrospirae bacterium]|nr:tetratricopeptide repeat protein [Nitrospirota bacterium]
MSLISDMLSKVKLPAPTRETPPGLRSDINQARQKKVGKKYKVALALSVIAGFLIITVAFLYQIYIVKAGDEIPENLHKLKSTEKRRATAKPQQTLSEKIEEALKEPPLKEKEADVDQKKSIFVKTPPPALLTEIVTADKESGDAGSTSAASGGDVIKEAGASAETGGLPVEVATATEPAIGSKDTYHLIYKADRSEKEQDYLTAIAMYENILKIEPTNHIIMNKIATLLMNMKMWKEAMDRLRESYKIKKDYIPSLINIGIVYANTGNYLKAEKFLLQALDLDPINQDAVFSTALLYEKEKNFGKAGEFYSRLGKLGDVRGMDGLTRVTNYSQFH